MCLAVPAKVLSIDGVSAEVDMEGVKTTADVSIVPEVKAGDYVIVHAGLAIQIYDEDEAQETLKAIRDFASGTAE